MSLQNQILVFIPTMAAEFVQAGLGCSITDIFSAEHTLPESMIYPLKEGLHLAVSVFHRADKPLTKAAKIMLILWHPHLKKK